MMYVKGGKKYCGWFKDNVPNGEGRMVREGGEVYGVGVY